MGSLLLRLDWVCSLGERRVGGFLEERGCVMSTWIPPNSGLSHPHQPLPFTEGTFLGAIVVLSSIPGLRPSLAPYYPSHIGPAPQPGKWDLWGSGLVNPSRPIPWFYFSHAGHLTCALTSLPYSPLSPDPVHSLLHLADSCSLLKGHHLGENPSDLR